MVKANGIDAKNSTICKVCGARLNLNDGECPNKDRRDHKGEPYNGRA